jgi:hypothetical protein
LRIVSLASLVRLLFVDGAEGEVSMTEFPYWLAFAVDVKSPSESKTDWDYYKIQRTIPVDQAAIHECALVKQ